MEQTFIFYLAQYNESPSRGWEQLQMRRSREVVIDVISILTDPPNVSPTQEIETNQD